MACFAAAAQRTQSPAVSQPPEHRGAIVFSRGESDPPPAVAPAQSKADAVTATDEERSSTLITSFDFDVRLLPEQNALNVRAKLEIKNDSAQPLSKIPLQISSSLDWVGVRQIADGGASGNLPLHVRSMDSDIDHTGQVKEDIIVLQQPLASGATIRLEVLYAGTVALNGKRLERIGTPHEAALSSDWDRIAPGFIALRGFGNTLWHPAASPAYLLGDGAKLFHAIGAWKQRESAATVRMHITQEYEGAQPNLTLLDGQRVAVAAPEDSAPGATGPHIVTASMQSSPLGFAAPSIFIATREEASSNGVRVFAEPEHAANGETWQSAASNVIPLLSRWLGPERKRELLVVELPEEGDAPFALDNILFHSLRPVPADALKALLVNALSHAYFSSPRTWLEQGVPQFMSSIWTEQTAGRETALAELDAARVPLALAERQNEPLVGAADEVYYRTKSTYVLWMLRSLIDDDALSAALKQYRGDEDVAPKYFEQICETVSHQELAWFFDDWVYHDTGLPDLAITAVHSRAVPPASYLVEVEVSNRGNAVAPVPVTVRAGAVSTTQRLRIAGHSSAVTRFVVPTKPESVQINDGTVPETESSRHQQIIQ